MMLGQLFGGTAHILQPNLWLLLFFFRVKLLVVNEPLDDPSDEVLGDTGSGGLATLGGSEVLAASDVLGELDNLMDL